MSSTRLTAYFIGFLIISTYGIAQQRFDSGPYKGFLREEPELNKIELSQPIEVSSVRGLIFYSDDDPLSGAAFEMRDSQNRVFSAITDSNGRFTIPKAPSGRYEFKVTKNGFHSVIGVLIVSDKSSSTKLIRIQLQLGT